MAQEAYKSIYAYEWQGDSLLLAREAMLISFIEYYKQKFGKMPLYKSVRYIAYIISWNVWQMDGQRGVVPGSCHENKVVSTSLFGEDEVQIPPLHGMPERRHKVAQWHLLLGERLGSQRPINRKKRKTHPIYRPHKIMQAYEI